MVSYNIDTMSLVIGIVVGTVVGIAVGIVIKAFLADRLTTITRDTSGRIIEVMEKGI